MPPKKGDKHHDEKQGKGKDLRKAFEHMNRIQVLQQASQTPHTESIDTLLNLAQRELAAGEGKNAAALLRATEHFRFASLGSEHTSKTKLSAEMLAAVREQFEELAAKAAEHWDEADQDSTVSEIYEAAGKQALSDLRKAKYYTALELQRGAEALTHVKLSRQPKLKAGVARRQLIAS